LTVHLFSLTLLIQKHVYLLKLQHRALSPYLVRERHTRAISIIPPLRPPHKRLLHHRPQSRGQAPRIASQHATILRLPPTTHLRRLPSSSAGKPLPTTQQRQPVPHRPQHRIHPRHHHRPQHHRRNRIHHAPRPRARLRLRARPRPSPRPQPRRQPPAVLAHRPLPRPPRPLGREAPQPPHHLHQHRQRRDPRHHPRHPEQLRPPPPPEHHQVQAQQRPRRRVQVQQPREAEHVPGVDVGGRRPDCDAHFSFRGFFVCVVRFFFLFLVKRGIGYKSIMLLYIQCSEICMYVSESKLYILLSCVFCHSQSSGNRAL
ncbi:hypothetical protein F5X96DRAFT_693064, partial [Biscogniauxia mediterranea]